MKSPLNINMSKVVEKKIINPGGYLKKGKLYKSRVEHLFSRRNTFNSIIHTWSKNEICVFCGATAFIHPWNRKTYKRIYFIDSKGQIVSMDTGRSTISIITLGLYEVGEGLSKKEEKEGR